MTRFTLTQEQRTLLNQGRDYEETDADIAGPVVFEFEDPGEAFSVLATNLRVETDDGVEFFVYDDVLTCRRRQTRFDEISCGADVTIRTDSYGVIMLRPPMSSDWSDFHATYRGTAAEIVRAAHGEFVIPGD